MKGSGIISGSRKSNMKLDLHTHSTCSDGTLTPAELFKKAEHKELELFSITDHDNIDHVRFLEFNQDISSMKYVTGVEISAEFSTTLHILGYNFDPLHPGLNSELENLQQYRRNRNQQMIENMDRIGFPVRMEELIKESGGETIGRPHFARLLLKKGYVNSYEEAFEKYLAKGKQLYIDKKRLDPDKAIALIIETGGIPVLAHPYQTKLDHRELDNLVKKLKSYGLIGIETFYSQHTKSQIRDYLKLAEKYDLILTAGSDFHGENKPEIDLGLEVDYKYIKPFLERL